MLVLGDHFFHFAEEVIQLVLGMSRFFYLCGITRSCLESKLLPLFTFTGLCVSNFSLTVVDLIVKLIQF